MDLSICILTHNQPELLPLCVASCFEEINRAGVDGEVIVIDNASVDRYPEKLAQVYPHIRIIRNEQNLSFSAANNRGIRASTGHYTLILNDDAVLQQDSLQMMLKKLYSCPQVGAVGPKLINPDGSIQKGFNNNRGVRLRGLVSDILGLSDFFGKWRLTRFMLTRRGDGNKSGETVEIAGACLLARREALEAVGLFDEGFYYWFEDSDLCFRLLKAGWKQFFVAEAEVMHFGSTTFKTLDRSERTKMFCESQMRFMKKHWKPGRYWLSRLLLVLVFALRAPIAFVYQAWKCGGNLVDAKKSAGASLQIARWLIAGCD